LSARIAKRHSAKIVVSCGMKEKTARKSERKFMDSGLEITMPINVQTVKLELKKMKAVITWFVEYVDTNGAGRAGCAYLLNFISEDSFALSSEKLSQKRGRKEGSF